ncbi:class F sortase [Streptomyces sp. RKAG293]|uniref:class F sortase n=1 Tax=Streptomyces sp. RKAG293 TaxID=2893403 RepID=UPI0020343360|nr:class F sortase [Streptomyces sp. RKAG293]MCM2422271.1 class F sortase [Streptomyces sp. RKAG293]
MATEQPARKGIGAPVAVALIAVVGVALVRGGAAEQALPPQPAAAAAVDTIPGVVPPAARQVTPPLPASPPVRVRIPSIGVNAPLITVALDKDGWVGSPPPADKNLAGWFRNSPTPGAAGTSVIDGHVDNLAGPAVFYGLGALKKGGRIEVTRQDGRTAVFDVYGVEVFAKNAFPAKRVYGDTGAAELRVITCGGGYTEKGGYDGNVVVFARLGAVR